MRHFISTAGSKPPPQSIKGTQRGFLPPTPAAEELLNQGAPSATCPDGYRSLGIVSSKAVSQWDQGDAALLDAPLEQFSPHRGCLVCVEGQGDEEAFEGMGRQQWQIL